MRLHFTFSFLQLLGCILCPGLSFVQAQNCPENIDFESGTFNGWNCFIGTTTVFNRENEISLYPSGGAIPGRHTMYTKNSSNERDPYGGFPVNCPNGSGKSIRLGNDLAETEAEGVSYEFTIPANQNVYSLIYHYAVVFQDPHHEIFQQPRLVLEITNVTDNQLIECSSFTFIPYGSLLPGFYLSPNPGGNTPIWCKDWSAVSINLNGHAGKKIRLFFKTADCTFRRHFGYAYIDVNSECNSEFVGAAYCPDDNFLNVTAPFGYQKYTWYNNSFTQVVGSQQTISFSPLPVSGTTYAVEVMPYNGYGCTDTLYARLADTLTLKARAGVDRISCNGESVQLGVNSIPGLAYSWNPVAGLSNPKISNPFTSPAISTQYVLTTTNAGGGCADKDTVMVQAVILDSSIRVIGSAQYCSDSRDSSILRVQSGDIIEWYKDNRRITGAGNLDYRVTESGTYHAVLFNEEGCRVSTAKQTIRIDDPVAGIRYPIQYAVIDLPFDLKARKFGDSILWMPGTFLNTRSSYTPVFNGPSEQLYTIEIRTASGCLTVDTQLVKTAKRAEIYVPNAFTPNGDGLNDHLRPLLMGIKEVRFFKIFNRWGHLLFESKTDRPGWDGNINGTPQSNQVLVWVVEGLGVDNFLYRRKGTTVLIR